jgi:hypothetical protein
MSTPELLMLLNVLPKAVQDHPEWFSPNEMEAAQRLLTELRGSYSGHIQE